MSLTEYVKVIWEDFLSLVYPELCIYCRDNLVKNELYLCTTCRLAVPFTNYRLEHSNPLSLHFGYLPKVTAASAFLHFQDRGIAQSLLHKLKYRGDMDVGTYLGEWYGESIRDELKADLIIPVPIHKIKMKRRGFNQSELIASGLSKKTNIPVETKAVERIGNTSTQTKKSKVERLQNVSDIYRIKDQKLLEGKSVVILDDVITTGATIGQLCELVQPFVKKITILAIASGKQ